MSKMLTIVIPCYNVEAYLDKGLRTLGEEQFNELLEVLIIDDGSKDRTAEIAKSYVVRFPKIFRLIQKRNGGHGSVINRGIEEAKGKYFRVLDGDDWVNSFELNELLTRMKERNEDLLVDKRCEVHMKTNRKNHIPLPESVKPYQTYTFAEVCTRPDVSRYFIIHNFSVKTSLLQQNHVRVTEGVFYEDSEYVMKATGICRSIYFFDMEIYQYLIGNVNQSVSCQNFVKRYEHFDTVTRAMLAQTKVLLEEKDAAIAQYLFLRAKTVVLTQFYIALIYDTDRSRGKKRGRELAELLKKEYPQMYRLVKKKYHMDLCLHAAGVDYKGLQTMRKMCGKKD